MEKNNLNPASDPASKQISRQDLQANADSMSRLGDTIEDKEVSELEKFGKREIKDKTVTDMSALSGKTPDPWQSTTNIG